VITMEADAARGFFLGEVSLIGALSGGKMTAQGPVAPILRVVPLANLVAPKFQEFEASGGSPAAEAPEEEPAAAEEEPAAAEEETEPEEAPGEASEEEAPEGEAPKGEASEGEAPEEEGAEAEEEAEEAEPAPEGDQS